MYSQKLFGESNMTIMRSHFNMTEKDIINGMNIIWDWYKMQLHLPENAIDHHRIERLYGWNKYSIENTKQKIENLLLARASIPEIFTGRDSLSENILTAMDCVQYCFVPQITPENYRVVVCRYTDTDIKLYDPLFCMKGVFMIWDLKLRYDYSLGDVCIMDFGHFKLGHAFKIMPSMVKKCIYVIQECYSIRIKQIHIVNFPSYAQTILNMIKSAIKKKIVNRIIIHEKIEDLLKFIPINCLPKDYGGLAASCDELDSGLARKLMQTEEWRKWYAESEIKIADTSKMPEKEANKIGDALGIMGSFRKLDID